MSHVLILDNLCQQKKKLRGLTELKRNLAYDDGIDN